MVLVGPPNRVGGQRETREEVEERVFNVLRAHFTSPRTQRVFFCPIALHLYFLLHQTFTDRRASCLCWLSWLCYKP